MVKDKTTKQNVNIRLEAKKVSTEFEGKVLKNGNSLSVLIPRTAAAKLGIEKGSDVQVKLTVNVFVSDSQHFLDFVKQMERLLIIVPGLKNKADVNDLFNLLVIRAHCAEKNLSSHDYLSKLISSAPDADTKARMKHMLEVHELIMKDGNSMGSWLGFDIQGNIKEAR